MGVEYHFYAGEYQIYVPVTNIDETKTKLLGPITYIKVWMNQHNLKLNEGKTEILLIT